MFVKEETDEKTRMSVYSTNPNGSTVSYENPKKMTIKNTDVILF